MRLRRECEWLPEELDTYWNYEAERGDRYFSIRHGRSITRWMKKHLKSNARIIDVGAGLGFLSDQLRPMGFRSLCIEPNLTSRLKILERKYDAGFLGCVSSVHEIAEENFDAAVLVEVIEHMRQIDALNLLKSIRERLGLGGMLFITTPNAEELTKGKVCCPSCNTVFHKWQHLTCWNSVQIQDLLTEAGFGSAVIEKIDWDSERLPFISRLSWSLSRHFSQGEIDFPDLRIVATV